MFRFQNGFVFSLSFKLSYKTLLPGKVAENSLLGFHCLKNMRKSFCQFQKRWMLFLRDGMLYSGSGEDGESDVLRTGPGCPLRPPVSQYCPRG